MKDEKKYVDGSAIRLQFDYDVLNKISFFTVCGFPLGVNSGDLTDVSFAASSFNVLHEPRAARLNRVIGGGAWCAQKNTPGEYLEIDLGQKSYVTGISTQGKHGQDRKWVTEYELYHRPDIKSAYRPYKFANGTTKVSIVIYLFIYLLIYLFIYLLLFVCEV